MAKNILPLIRPLDEIKADLDVKKFEEADTDLEILYSNAVAYEELIQSIMANKRLAAEIASRWVRKNNKIFFDKNFRDHWYLIPKVPPESSKKQAS
jgi:hypothetical protein